MHTGDVDALSAFENSGVLDLHQDLLIRPLNNFRNDVAVVKKYFISGLHRRKSFKGADGDVRRLFSDPNKAETKPMLHLNGSIPRIGFDTR